MSELTKEQWERLLGAPITSLMESLMGMWLRQCDRQPIAGDSRISIPITPDARFDHLPCTYTVKPVSVFGKRRSADLIGKSLDYLWIDDPEEPEPWKPKQHSSAVTSPTALLIHEQVFS